MTILITGANGLLGQYLVRHLLQQNYNVIATGKGPDRLCPKHAHYTYHDMDICDATMVHTIIGNTRPDVLVHAAAMTQVDDCELNPALCERVNVTGTANVLTAAEATGAHVIYVSTDFVFDGEKGNYAEEDDLNPVNYYGFTKMQAEAMVQTSDIPWSIVRTCLVYGNVLKGTRQNIITWVRDNLSRGKTIKVVCDQWRTPTYVEDLATGIGLIAARQAQGIYHLSGKDLLTPYDMAMETAAYLKLDSTLITRVDAATFTQPGRRPPKTGFQIDKARHELGYEPITFREGLMKVAGYGTSL